MNKTRLYHHTSRGFVVVVVLVVLMVSLAIAGIWVQSSVTDLRQLPQQEGELQALWLAEAAAQQLAAQQIAGRDLAQEFKQEVPVDMPLGATLAAHWTITAQHEITKPLPPRITIFVRKTGALATQVGCQRHLFLLPKTLPPN